MKLPSSLKTLFPKVSATSIVRATLLVGRKITLVAKNDAVKNYLALRIKNLSRQKVKRKGARKELYSEFKTRAL